MFFKPAYPISITWKMVMDLIARVVDLRQGNLPIVLSSLPNVHAPGEVGPPVSIIHGPPGRNIALAIGLRAALPDTPLLLVMNADAITLGTNHLIHAARRNIGMTLLILRAEVTQETEREPLDRMRWGLPDYQEDLETMATPLEWVTALQAAFVGRGSLLDPDKLAEIVNAAIDTPGFSVVGVTAGADLEMGVLSRNEWPEYFTAYRQWVDSLISLTAGKASFPKVAALPAEDRVVPRHEVRIVGIGGQGVKLAGSVLSEAIGLYEGLWSTHRGEYGSATRGGPSMVDVVFGSEPITYPGADTPDILVILSQGGLERHSLAAKPECHVIVDPDQVKEVPARALAVPVVQLARQHVGRPIAAGAVSLGCVAALTQFVTLDSLRESLAKKVPFRTVEKNLAALQAGYETTREALEQR